MRTRNLVQILVDVGEEGHEEAPGHPPDPGRVVEPLVDVPRNGVDERELVTVPAQLRLRVHDPVHECLHVLADERDPVLLLG